jgi:hypothetical protein
MAADDIVIYLVGDVGPNRENPDSMFAQVAAMLKGGDVGFCQLEENLSIRGTPLPQARLPMRADPSGARAIRNAGFHVVSFAGNHCMDWGSEAFQDTRENLAKENLAVIGAGSNIDEARRPAIIECKQNKIAFLAYSSILPEGYWAEENRPGCAPMRASTLYEQVEHDQPGTPCRIHTFPHRADLASMREDIHKAKALADIVIVSMHWGIHFIPAVISDYEREVGHQAIDAGANLIVGHHPHILKGIEIYKGKAIFYSLANFALELPFAFDGSLRDSSRHAEIASLNPKWDTDPEFPMPPDTRRTIAVKCRVSGKQIHKISYLPAYLNVRAEPEFLAATDARFAEVREYVAEITRSQGLAAQFSQDGNEIIVGGASDSPGTPEEF